MAILTKQPRKQVIDLTGPQGNAYYLIGAAMGLMKNLEYTSDESEAVLEKMRGSDYENLIETFDEHFGSIIDLER